MRISGLNGIGRRASTYASGIVTISVRTVTTMAMRKPSCERAQHVPLHHLGPVEETDLLRKEMGPVPFLGERPDDQAGERQEDHRPRHHHPRHAQRSSHHRKAFGHQPSAIGCAVRISPRPPMTDADSRSRSLLRDGPQVIPGHSHRQQIRHHAQRVGRAVIHLIVDPVEDVDHHHLRRLPAADHQRNGK